MFLARNQELIDIYDEGWKNATSEMNKVGLMDDMFKLAGNLSPVDPNVIPPGMRNFKSKGYDTAFFTQRGA